MSYENTHCPCGGKKVTDTMLCNECETEFSEHVSMKTFRDESARVESRRHAAIILLSLARRRKK